MYTCVTIHSPTTRRRTKEVSVDILEFHMFWAYTFVVVVFDLNAISFIMKMKMAHFAFVLLLADDTLMLMGGNHNLSIKLFPILFV